MLLGRSPGYLPFTQSQALLAGFPLYLVLPLPTDALGRATLTVPIPDDTGLLGSELTFQSVGVTAQLDFVMSNGVLMRFCPK